LCRYTVANVKRRLKLGGLEPHYWPESMRIFFKGEPLKVNPAPYTHACGLRKVEQ
jgi:hypothetical protein